MKRNLRKGIVFLIASINMLILTSITNNDFIIDLILLIIFAFNSMMILKYDHKYINLKDDDYDRI